MRVLFIACLLMCPAVADSQENTLATSFAGCYELKVETWHLFKSYGDQFLPKRFELTTRSTQAGLTIKNLDPKVRSDLWLSSWKVIDQEEIEIIWGTGYVGWNIQLSKSGSEFRGTGKFFTDTSKDPWESDKVVARALGCKSVGK